MSALTQAVVECEGDYKLAAELLKREPSELLHDIAHDTEDLSPYILRTMRMSTLALWTMARDNLAENMSEMGPGSTPRLFESLTATLFSLLNTSTPSTEDKPLLPGATFIQNNFGDDLSPKDKLRMAISGVVPSGTSAPVSGRD